MVRRMQRERKGKELLEKFQADKDEGLVAALPKAEGRA